MAKRVRISKRKQQRKIRRTAADLSLRPEQAEQEQEHESEGLDSNQIASVIQNPTSSNMTPNVVMQLQRQYGNQFVNSLARRQTVSKAPQGIQRLSVDENYFYGSTEKDVNTKDLRLSPAYKKLVANIRMYHLLANNPVTVNGASALLQKLTTIENAVKEFDVDIFRLVRKADRAGKKSQFVYLEDVTITTLDDVKQDREAISAIQSNPAFRINRMTWRDALFIARLGETPDSILTEGDLAAGQGTNDVGNPEKLGGGMISEVTALDYQQDGGGSKRRVFKPNEKAPGSPIDSINKLNVQTTYRAMAVSRVNAMIKAKMVEAGREFKSLVGNFDVAQYKGQVGSVADFAEGKDAAKNIGPNPAMPDKVYRLNVDISDVSLQQQLANLQLFDIITGQIDRHLGNMLIDQGKDKETKVTGIDNDFTFSTDTDLTKNVGVTTLPEKIDRYFAEAILAITQNEFLDQLKGLRKQDKEAALARLAEVQKLLATKLANNELLVAPGDTDHPDAPSWADVDTKSYRSSDFKTGIKDYAGELQANRNKAYKAVLNNPALEPEQDEKGRWVLEYSKDVYLQASEDDGSDLFALVEEARKEAAWSKKKSTNDRAGFNIGSRGRTGVRQGLSIGGNRKRK